MIPMTLPDLQALSPQPYLLRARRTKIIATLGPASSSAEMLRKLFLAGVDTFRLNFSHGTHDDHSATHARIRALEAQIGQPIGILQDLQGPKIRLGCLTSGPRIAVAGDTIVLRCLPMADGIEILPLPHPEIFSTIVPGHRLLIDDGRVSLVVTDVANEAIFTRVEAGGRLSDRKGVNVPDTVVALPAMTKKDHADLKFGLSLGVDWVALSFVQRIGDLSEARALIGDRAGLVAKVEKPSALLEIEEIIAASDAVMIARGDLGVEIPPEDVPGWQKDIVRLCRAANRPVIVATQMLESMTQTPTPTRAEASDVATAVQDGTDVVMLSAETATGAYPEESVQMMDRILRRVECHESYRPQQRALRLAETAPGFVIARAAADMTRLSAVPAIVAFSTSGATGLRLAACRPSCPILVLTSTPSVARRLCLAWGVRAMLGTEIDNHDEVAFRALDVASSFDLAKSHDPIIVVCGFPFGVSGTTNSLRLLTVGT
jgi:pyruvate kinase